MVDIHSHIIPNVDDGSKSVAETFNMIKEAENVGFTDIMLTSHFLLNHYETKPEELTFWREKLQEILKEENYRINLHSGMEIYITNDLIDLLKENKVLTLAGSRYVLIELPLTTTVKYLDEVLYSVESAFIKPIIAHPERYKCVQNNIKIVEEFIQKGALTQCNYGSIMGLYGKEAKSAVKKLLKNKQVNFLGSDCHREKTIYPIIPKAIKKIKKIVGEEEFVKISKENPIKILKNEDWLK